MRYFRFEIEGSELQIYPIVCWHLGAKQSSATFIDHIIKRIKGDPQARWIYMGDGGECVTKTSKGNIYEQTMNPGEQLRVLADLLIPIKDKGLYGIRGNHGNRIDKDTGLGWDEVLCTRIGIPYLGVSALGDIILGQRKNNHTLSFSLYTHHGAGGSTTPGGGLTAAHKPQQFIDADLVLTAHTHQCGEVWPTKVTARTSLKGRCVEWKRTYAYVCGSAYDSRSGYAEEKMYSPLLPAHLCITASMENTWKNKSAGRGLKFSHEKIEGRGEEFGVPTEEAKWREG